MTVFAKVVTDLIIPPNHFCADIQFCFGEIAQLSFATLREVERVKENAS